MTQEEASPLIGNHGDERRSHLEERVMLPDPELLPIRPRCPKCHSRMLTLDVSPGPEGFERRTFGCSKCGHSEESVIACDPMRSNAVGWTLGELKHPK